MVHRYFISIFFIILQLTNVYSDEKANAQCIHNYQELKTSLLNNTDNIDNLLLAFYPPNKPPAHVLNVYYYIQLLDTVEDEDNDTNQTHPHFEEPTTTADYIFQWVDSSTLLLTEIRLFQALSFGIIKLEIGNVDITIDPFCDEDKAIDLLNVATVWLKSYATNIKETDRYYSLYFNEKKFVVLGNSVRGSTHALVVCEYCAAIGSLIVIYTILLLSKYEMFSPIQKVFSDISVPCLVFTAVIFGKDAYYYNKSFQYVTSEWLRSFPMPIIFPVCSFINLILSIITVVIIGHKFPLPGLLDLFYSNISCRSKFYRSCIQVIMIFSISSFAVLLTFHFAWVVLAFSAYPIRCIASQAFILPFISITLAIYFAIDYVASSPRLILNMKYKLKRIVFTLVIAFLMVPFIIALLGVLYYYSQVLIEVNDSESSPVKTIIGGLVPTVVTAFVAWTGKNAVKAYIEVNKDAEPFDTHSNVTMKEDSGVEQLELRRYKTDDEEATDNDHLLRQRTNVHEDDEELLSLAED